jgi:Protein of unknown function DUF262
MAMRSTNTNMTIAEYLEQLRQKQITINHDYQRTDKVWPVSAKSNLMDTILNGFPIPKLIFSQTTDLDTLKTRKEVVDGQQRTAAISEYFNNRYALTRGDLTGHTFAELPQENKREFMAYELSIDVFTSGSDEEIREVFRRINSYQVPLNNQEKRHATHQGDFKWFIRDLGDEYSTALKKIGVVSERQVSRMVDLEFLTELVHLLESGVKTASPAALNKLYTNNDKEFPDKNDILEKLRYGLGKIIDLNDIHDGPLMARGNFYSLFGAIISSKYPTSPPAIALQLEASIPKVVNEAAIANLTALAEAINSDDPSFHEFVEAARQATNTEKNRTIRMRWLYRALTSRSL